MADIKDSYTLEALLTGDNSRLKRVIDQAVVMLEKLENKKVDDIEIDGDVKPLRKKVESAKRLTEMLDGKRAQIEIIARNAEAIKNLRQVRLSAKRLSKERPKIDVDVQTGAANANIKRFKAMLKSIPNKVRTRVDVDYDRNVFSRISAGWRQIQNVNNKFGDDMDQLANSIRAFGTVSANMIKGSLVSSFTALIPIVAALVPAIMAVGNAIAVVGGGALGLVGAFAVAGGGVASFGALAISAYKMYKDGAIQASDATQKFESSLSSFKSEWESLAQKNAGSIFSTMTNGINIAKTALTGLTPFITGVSKSMEGLSASVLKWSQTSAVAKNFFDVMKTSGVTVFQDIMSAAGKFGSGLISLFTSFMPLFEWVAKGFSNMGTQFNNWSQKVSTAEGIKNFIAFVQESLPKIGQIFGNVFEGIFNLFKAFAPNSQTLFDSLVQMSTKFAEWSATIAASDGFQKFIEYVQTNGPTIMSLIGSIVMAVVNFGIAVAPLGQVVLQLVTAFAQWLSTLFQTNPVVAQIVGALISLIGVAMATIPTILGIYDALQPLIMKFIEFKGESTLLQGALRLLGSAFTALSGPVLAIIGVFVAIGMAIVGLWQSNEQFRSNVSIIWQNIQTIISAVGQVIMNIFGLIVSSLGILSQAFMPVISGIVSLVATITTWIASFIEANQWIITVVSVIAGLVVAFFAVQSAIALVTTIVGVLTTALGILGTIISVVAGVFAFLLTPVGLVVAAIGLVIAAVVICYQKFEAFRNFLAPLVDFFIGIGEGIKQGLGSALDWISEKLGMTATKTEEATGRMANATNINTSKMASDVTSNSALMTSGFDVNMNRMSMINDSQWAMINGTATSQSGAMQAAVLGSVGGMSAQTTGLLAGMSGSAQAEFASLYSAGSGQASSLNADVLSSLGGMSSQGVGDIASMTSGINSEFQNMSGTSSSATSNMSSNVQSNMNSMRSSFTSGASGIAQAWASAMQRITSITSSGMSAVRSASVSGMQAVVSAFRSGGQQAVSVTTSSMAACASVMRSAYGQFSSAGSYVMSGFIAGMNSQRGAVMATAASIANAASAQIRSALKIHSPSRVTMKDGKWFGQGFAIGIMKKVPQVIQASKTMANSAVKALSKMKTNSYDKAKQGSKSFYESLSKTSQSASNKLSANNKKIASIQQKLKGKIWKSTRSRLNKQLIDLRKENKAYTVQKNTITKLRSALSKSTNQLLSIANKREKVADKLKGAQDNLKQVLKDRQNFKDGIIDSTRSFGSISNSKVSTQQGLVADMRARLKAVNDYAKNINALKKKGVHKNIIADLLSAGVEGGAGQAKILANASKNTIKQINTVQKQIMSVTSSLAERQAKDFYTVGLNTAKGIVQGLQKQDKALQKAAERIANTITNTVKKKLGIHSPSRVFKALGIYTMQGFIGGIDKLRTQSINKMANLSERVSEAFTPRFVSGLPDLTGNLRNATANIASQVNADVVNTVRSEPVGVTLNANFALGNHDYNAFVGDITDKQNSRVRLQETYNV
ncbi:hypothetical protein [Macrococcoides caseolyticum]|uniref:hypothetical protein n=1 Tax=Macrococcoides caseolyticum TaxID=69966 RepID=UPI000C34A303|nr:hypothetical protein [Macrococcus caseolyticus]PKE33944.1 hypothetical protein CW668_03920 [Macrococcus caseolyticus]